MPVQDASVSDAELFIHEPSCDHIEHDRDAQIYAGLEQQAAVDRVHGRKLSHEISEQDGDGDIDRKAYDRGTFFAGEDRTGEDHCQIADHDPSDEGAEQHEQKDQEGGGTEREPGIYALKHVL